MTTSPAVRFVGMLSSPSAESAARERMRAIEGCCARVTRWDVSVQPPLSAWPQGGYAVRAQAELADGCTIAIRAQSDQLLDAVRDAFDGVAQLLVREYGPPLQPAARHGCVGRAALRA